MKHIGEINHFRKIVREVLSEDYNRESIETKKYSDEDYDWFEEVFPLKMDRNKLSSVSDLYTIHYGDKGKSIIRLSGDRCHINTIAVIDDYKNSGIGSKILQAVISLCESAGVKLITANVSENNIPSINLFVNSGFKQNEDVTDRFYDDKSQKLAYYLELNSDNLMQEELKLKSPIGQGKDHVIYDYEGDPTKVVKVAWGDKKGGSRFSPDAEIGQIDLDPSHIGTFKSNPDLFAKVHKVTNKYAIIDKLDTNSIDSEQVELYNLLEPLFGILEDLDHMNENNAINRLYWLMSNRKGFKENLMRELITSGIFFSSPLLQKYIDFLQGIISSSLGRSNKNLDVSSVNIGYDSEGLLKMLDF